MQPGNRAQGTGKAAPGADSPPRSGRRFGRDPGYSREWSGGTYPGHIEGGRPHPRRSRQELERFKSEGLWSCDLIDGMLFLAPDGFPKSQRYPGGQEAVFKKLLERINIKAGGASAAEDAVRRVFREFIEDLEHQRKPFKRDAAVLVKKLYGLLPQLQGGK